MRFFALSFCILLSFSSYAADFPGNESQTSNVMKLSASSFPETKFDTSFTERVDSLTEGYAPFETVWDKNGNCVSGCAYSGMTVETERKRLEHDAEIVQQKIDAYCAENPDICNPPKIEPTESTPSVERACLISNPKIPVGQTIPRGEPLMGLPRISSPCALTRYIPELSDKPHSHIALDFSAIVGTPVFAPANGTVTKILHDNTCGDGIFLQHAGGFSTLYCHLSNTSMVTVGQKIDAGCIFARTGNTGRSTGPHLHYSVRINGKAVCPSQFISRQNF
ncbi:MAG: M23 family metallopeptidase [Alphaproteobacteria bacterium]